MDTSIDEFKRMLSDRPNTNCKSTFHKCLYLHLKYTIISPGNRHLRTYVYCNISSCLCVALFIVGRYCICTKHSWQFSICIVFGLSWFLIWYTSLKKARSDVHYFRLIPLTLRAFFVTRFTHHLDIEVVYYSEMMLTHHI